MLHRVVQIISPTNLAFSLFQKRLNKTEQQILPPSYELALFVEKKNSDKMAQDLRLFFFGRHSPFSLIKTEAKKLTVDDGFTGTDFAMKIGVNTTFTYI